MATRKKIQNNAMKTQNVLVGGNEGVTNILLVGVGGQGVILASKILTEALVHAGFDVKKSEVHGMAQRGGSVLSHVRFGSKVFSPLVKKGEGDVLLSFEQLETLRYLDYLNPEPTIFVNDQKILPPSVSMGLEAYPEDIPQRLKKAFKNTFLVEGLLLARKAGNLKAVNTVLLGALSRCLPIGEKTWIKTLRERFPKQLQAVNIDGFYLGRACQPAN